MSVTKVQKAIVNVQFEINRKIKAIERVEQKSELSENEKVRIESERRFIDNINFLINDFKLAINANLGKIPPAAVDLEETILGAVMLESQKNPVFIRNADGELEERRSIPAIKKVITFLKAEHFYDERHVAIYEAISQLDSENESTDARAVHHRLRKNGKIELIGGPVYLLQLTSAVSSAANLEYHARVMIEFAIKRQLILMASDLMHHAYEDTSDALELLDIAESQITEAAKWRKRK